MTSSEGRIIRLELMLVQAQARLATLDTRATSLEGQARQSSGMPYNWGGGGAVNASYWCMSPAGGWAASSGTFPTITPTGGSVTVYVSSGGTFTALGTRSVRWWYRDACPQYMLVPLAHCADGSFDAVANGCSVVNP